ncbi:MAG TPA: hypothetical protein DCE80_08990, partial [Ignavibacteriales bacterium]|nr:hypothetical protein [Ignavibacteriales bacterium]
FLDIGAGEGKTLVEGLNRGWYVTGIDIVDNRINDAKEDGIKFIRAKFLEYEFPKNHFDFLSRFCSGTCSQSKRIFT